MNYKDKIHSLLCDSNQGDFVTSGIVEAAASTQIAVRNVGRLRLPLSSEQATVLISQMEQAPFGKGMDTMVDVNVRKAWQLDPSQVTLGDRWRTSSLNNIVANACTALGVDKVALGVEARLYKLLCYESGGHFQKHRDTEKEPGMFGTLLIQLPAEHEGGDLVVEHKGVKRRFSFASDSADVMHYVSFFADCEHTLEPVTKGLRLVLAYNLVRTKNTLACQLPSAARIADSENGLVEAVKLWQLDAHGPEKLVIPLEHRYTSTNLSFAGLKGGDRELLDRLLSVHDPQSPGGTGMLDVYACLVEKHVTGAGHEYDSDMEEEYETNYSVLRWEGADGKANFPSLKVFHHGNYDEALGVEFDEDIFGDDPDSKEHEYTGNEGCTCDYWYYATVLVFWPKKNSLKITCSASFDGALTLVETEFKDVNISRAVESLTFVLDYADKNTNSVLDQFSEDERVARLIRLCRLCPSSALPSTATTTNTSTNTFTNTFTNTSISSRSRSSSCSSGTSASPSDVRPDSTAAPCWSSLLQLLKILLKVSKDPPSYFYGSRLQPGSPVGICGMLTAKELALSLPLIASCSTSNANTTSSSTGNSTGSSTGNSTGNSAASSSGSSSSAAASVSIANVTPSVSALSTIGGNSSSSSSSSSTRPSTGVCSTSDCSSVVVIPGTATTAATTIATTRAPTTTATTSTTATTTTTTARVLAVIKDLLNATMESKLHYAAKFAVFCKTHATLEVADEVAALLARIIERRFTASNLSWSTFQPLLDYSCMFAFVPGVASMLPFFYEKCNGTLKLQLYLPASQFAQLHSILSPYSSDACMSVLHGLMGGVGQAVSAWNEYQPLQEVLQVLKACIAIAREWHTFEAHVNAILAAMKNHYRLSKSFLDAIIADTGVLKSLTDSKNSAFIDWCKSRYQEAHQLGVEPAFSWRMPHASMPYYPEVEAFLRGPDASYTLRAGIYSLPSARKFVQTYCYGSMRASSTYSVQGSALGRGRDACVQLQKTKDYFNFSQRQRAIVRETNAKLRHVLANSGVTFDSAGCIVTPPIDATISSSSSASASGPVIPASLASASANKLAAQIAAALATTFGTVAPTSTTTTTSTAAATSGPAAIAAAAAVVAPASASVTTSGQKRPYACVSATNTSNSSSSSSSSSSNEKAATNNGGNGDDDDMYILTDAEAAAKKPKPIMVDLTED